MSEQRALVASTTTVSTPRVRGRFERRVAVVSALALAVLGLALAGAAYLLRDPMPRFTDRRSSLVSWEEGAAEMADGHAVQPVRLVATSGLAVDLMIKWPLSPSGTADTVRRPLVVLLGGHRTGRDAVELIGDTRGAVIAALSYPFAGQHRVKGLLPVLRQAPRIRDAVLDTPPALMLALDYLMAREDTDPHRVEGVGVSLGVPFICIAGALDRHFTRIWAVHGSGGSFVPLAHNLRRSVEFAPVRLMLAGLATVIIAGPQLAPERWVARIAPRPFIMVNAEDDERLPRDAIISMYESASQPKELIWLPGGHVRPNRDVVRDLVDVVLDRMLGPEAEERDSRSPIPGS